MGWWTLSSVCSMPPAGRAATHLFAAVLSLAGCAVQTTNAQPADDELARVVERASAYVTAFERDAHAIIWNERYDQVDRLPLVFGASGSRFTRVNRRSLTSEMLFIWVDGNATSLTVRDVITVDSRPVVRRLPGLLKSQNIKLQNLRTLSDENGRYNIGRISRNFNEPTLALLFLDPRYQARFEFTDGGMDDIQGRAVRRVQFTEIASPTVIRTLNRDAWTSGTLWVDPADGRVFRTELSVIQDLNNTWGDIIVTFGPNPRFSILVPVAMTETYGFPRSKPNEIITGTAQYSDFRRFETAGRLILP